MRTPPSTSACRRVRENAAPGVGREPHRRAAVRSGGGGAADGTAGADINGVTANAGRAGLARLAGKRCRTAVAVADPDRPGDATDGAGTDPSAGPVDRSRRRPTAACGIRSEAAEMAS